MVRAYKCVTEITVHSVTAPRTWLPNRDDIYLTIEMFNQVKRTRLTDPIFPLVFHDRFSFEKIFWTASDPLEVTEMLEDLPVVVELRQVTDVYLGGALLAYFDSNARDFLSPYPTTTPRLEGGRELIMCRTVDFTGMSPKLEFTTYTIIEECSDSYTRSVDEPYLGEPVSRTLRRLQSAAKETRSRFVVNGGYERQTVSSALRSRSPSPAARLSVEEELRDEISPPRRSKKRVGSAVELRPPFVVRKVDPTMLLRKPKLHDNYKGLLVNAYKKKQKRRSRSVSPTRGLSDSEDEGPLVPSRLSCEVCNLTNNADMNLRDFDNVPPEPPTLKIMRETKDQRPVYETSRHRRVSFSDDDDERDEDLEVANINRRPPSPVTYYPSLRDRYSPLIKSTSSRICQRVHEAQRLNSSPLTY